MIVTSLPRRLLVGATASALLLGGGAFSLLSSASAAGVCPTYTDPAGDSALVVSMPTPDGIQPLTNPDDDLDLLDVSQSTDGGVFSSTMHVKKLADLGPQVAFSDYFRSLFTVGGKAVLVEVIRDLAKDTAVGGGAELFTRATVAGTAQTFPVKAVLDLKASTVSLSLAASDLEKAVGTPLADKPLTAMSAIAGSFLGPEGTGLYRPEDTATAPTTASYVFGASCSGSSTPPPVTPPPITPPATTPPPAAGGSTLYDLPRKGCVQFTDPAGDAMPLPTGNSDDLDITSVVSRTTATLLDIFVHVAKLGTGPGAPFSGHQFDLAYTVGGKAVTLSGTVTGPAASTVAGAAKDLKATVAFDTKSSNVVFSTPLSSIEAAAGSAVTAESAKTTALSSVQGNAGPSRSGDTAAPTADAQKTYVVGDNTCFLPEAGLLTIDADATGQFTDATELFATLTDVDQLPVEGATVTVKLGGLPAVTATTDADGLVDVTVPLTSPAGPAPIVVTFAGSDTVGAVSATTPFTVVVEKTLLSAKAGKGTVTATVKDDDGHVVAGQPVTFLVGKKVTTARTDARGVAVLKGLTKGTSVKVGFAAVAKRFAAAPSVTTKAL